MFLCLIFSSSEMIENDTTATHDLYPPEIRKWQVLKESKYTGKKHSRKLQCTMIAQRENETRRQVYLTANSSFFLISFVVF